MAQILAVAVGGAAGAVLRFTISHAVDERSASLLPIGTFAVNLLGCLLLGFCAEWLVERAGATARQAVNVGLIGALTTFSTFALDALRLLGAGEHRWAGAYIVASVGLGLAAAYLGMVAGRAAFGP